MCNTVCMTSVDLPIPGSPPIRTREPGTSPPPNTRFNSSSCILIRGSSSATISASASGLGFCVSIPDTGRRLTGSFLTISSTYVFHSPQDGHLPTHFGESCPQLLHTYTVFSFAIELPFFVVGYKNRDNLLEISYPCLIEIDVCLYSYLSGYRTVHPVTHFIRGISVS